MTKAQAARTARLADSQASGAHTTQTTSKLRPSAPEFSQLVSPDMQGPSYKQRNSQADTNKAYLLPYAFLQSHWLG